MIRLTELKLPLDHPPEALRAAALARLGVEDSALGEVTVFRRGYDARRRSDIKLVYTLDVTAPEEAALLARHAGERGIGPAPDMAYRMVASAPSPLGRRPLVIGAGPCGLMAALTLAQMGFRPIILERGRVVRERTRDTFRLWRKSVLDPESNVQFGEGGAGTFSDGKLWSGIKDPAHLGRRVLEEFVRAGAPPEILVSSKPHVGTFRLVTMVESIRRTIESLGGEYRFGCRVADFAIETHEGGQRIVGVTLADGEEIAADHVVLAPGHSARDLFETVHARGVFTEPKPFSIGVRIEHPQSVIDRARFGGFAGNKLLGAADYKLVHHTPGGRSVYSFCMCPGGTVCGRHVGAGARRDKRDEPVFACRAGMRTRGSSWGSRRRIIRAGRWRAWRFSAIGSRWLLRPVAAPTRRLVSAWVTSWLGARAYRSATWCLPTSPTWCRRTCRCVCRTMS